MTLYQTSYINIVIFACIASQIPTADLTVLDLCDEARHEDLLDLVSEHLAAPVPSRNASTAMGQALCKPASILVVAYASYLYV